MKKGLIFGLMFLVVLAFSTPAKAVMVLPSWDFDFSGIDGLAAGTTVLDVGQITYYGIAHAHVYDTDFSGTSDPGESFITDGLLTATGLTDSGGVQILPGVSNLGVTYEITFDFSVEGEFISRDPVTSVLTFIHSAPNNADGLLEMYVNNFANMPPGGTDGIADAGAGTGYQDGTLIATFIINPGLDPLDGGVFSPLSFDGSDDALFQLQSAIPGVIFDEYGNDLTTDPLNHLLAITDSNFDGDPTHTNGFSIIPPGSWPHALQAYGSEIDFFAREDGSAVLGTHPIPEPATMLLLGSGLLGLGAFGRRKTKRN